MTTELTNFYECGKDLADVYVSREDIEYQVLTNIFDRNKLSEVGFDEITCNTVWGWGWNISANLGQGGGTGIFDGVQYCSPIITNTTNEEWRYVSTSGVANISSLAIKQDNTLWLWGSNSSGKLGNGTTSTTRTPTQEISFSTWCTASTSTGTSSGIKQDGTLWSWGSNTCGALGINDGATSAVCSPVQELTSSTWVSVDLGDVSTFAAVVAIKNDSTIWEWGRVESLPVARSSPTQELSSSSDWCYASSNGTRSAIKTGGTLWSWGGNGYGQLGDNSITAKSSPVQESTSSSVWCAVAPSGFFTTAIKTDGTIWSWGRNCCAQLGDGTIVDKSTPTQEVTSSTDWKYITGSSGGVCHNTAIKTDGTIWSWGSGDAGTLGINCELARCSPVQEICGIDTWLQAYRSGYSVLALKR